MGFANALNETHQWARTLTVGGTAPSAPGQLVTLTSSGWTLATSANLASAEDLVLKVVKSVDDLSLTDSGAFVRGVDVSDYSGKITVYWENFVGNTDNYVSTNNTYNIGTELTLDSSGKLVPAVSTNVVIGIVEEVEAEDPEAEANGITFIQVTPYKKS